MFIATHSISKYNVIWEVKVSDDVSDGGGGGGGVGGEVKLVVVCQH